MPIQAAPAAAVTLPAGFQEQIVFSGLTNPTNVEFAPDGRIFVVEQRGTIKVFDDLADTTPTLFADLSGDVQGHWDRGLLGLALPPNFPTSPYVYVTYAYKAPLGGGPVMNDACSGASGGENGGNCVVSARLSRLQAAGNVMTGTEQVLINDWCQQFPSHSIGDLKFGQDGMLYLSAGDGASFSATDYGQFGSPANPCNDAPGGTALTPPTAEGGALRSQDVRSTGDPTALNGAVLRLDPATGLAAPGNPLIASADLNARRIVAHGLRNPYRFTIRPGTNELWIGDVGWNTWEEVNRVVNPTAAVTNFGWPCYEGVNRMGSYDNANLNLCESLYTEGSTTAPYYAYDHNSDIVPGEACAAGGDAIAGLTFYPGSGGTYPAQYAGALFFTDSTRQCIWAMKPTTAGGLPSPSNIERFALAAARPVDLAVGPGSELYYVDYNGGTVRRIRYFPGNQPPTSVISAVPTNGATPLTVTFNGAGSTDPDPADAGRLTYAWDFTDNGSTDATTAATSFIYTTAGTYTARLTVTDTLGVVGSSTVSISVGNDAPTAFVDTPAVGLTWSVGNVVSFTGHATDPQQGTLPASALTWNLRIQHCASVGNCHNHNMQTFTGVASGSFVAPDHEYPSYLELELVATDAQGLTSTVVRRLDPNTVDLTFNSTPPGLQLTVGSTTQVAPFTRTVIRGSANTVSAPTPQVLGSTGYSFGSWSDAGAQTHVITAPTNAASYTATYSGTPPACSDSFGYVCTESAFTWTPASTLWFLNGDDNYHWLDLPFSMPFYGGNYSRIWVDTNGALSFQAFTDSAYDNSAIPSAATPNRPNLALYPLWQDLIVDSSAGIYTSSAGTAPNRTFTVEFRNVRFFDDAAARVSFEVVLAENGVITYGYTGIDPAVPMERGSTSTIGIENGAGTVAVQYSLNQPKLTSGRGVVFTPPGATPPPPPPPPPAPGSVSGTVTNAGTPVAGAAVQLVGTALTTTTAANGTYSFASVPVGTYTVSASSAGGRCAGLGASAPVTVASNANSTVNLALVSAAGGAGYTCVEGPFTFVPASTVLALAGDDSANTANIPFSVPFYGGSYNKVWVDTNGVVSFQAPNGSSWDHSAIPSAAAPNRPNLSLYPFWVDLIVDGSASVRTQTIGTAPNRQFVIEWRNAKFFTDQTRRVDFEVLLGENGVITFAYANIDATVPLEQGSTATVGIENGAGTVALQYAFREAILASGRGITFTPGA
ncbi:glucose/arabinose dehydrogenase [Allocatelliglobosispora scoriae]|uniref:alpha-amylase n=1 Tax=Allocatelliglobosispora scoriae TaxID=643052 RepID=A0A841BY72_9ACTN|nr:PQQ-dependent sugar dehydrogenase [Allocatelliglobosispora scoriae]MBB5872069.1 glucose/arabinose dehydrogenase [Allocatelliglobosispora scoriae]